MAALVCDVCGGKLVMDESRQFSKCDSCGLEYSVDTMREMIKALEGAELNVKGVATDDSLVEYAYSMIDQNVSEAEAKFKEALQINPKNSKAWKGLYDCQKWSFYFDRRLKRFSFQYLNEEVYGHGKIYQAYTVKSGDDYSTCELLYDSIPGELKLTNPNGGGLSPGHANVVFGNWYLSVYGVSRISRIISSDKQSAVEKYLQNAINCAENEQESQSIKKAIYRDEEEAKEILQAINKRLIKLNTSLYLKRKEEIVNSEKRFRDKRDRCLERYSKLSFGGECKNNPSHLQDYCQIDLRNLDNLFEPYINTDCLLIL